MIYRTSDLARACGKSEKTIHEWAKKELVPFERDKNGWKVFDEESLKIALELCGMRSINISDSEIQKLKETADATPFSPPEYHHSPDARHWYRRGDFQLVFTRDLLPDSEMYHLSASYYDRSCTNEEMNVLNDTFFSGKAVEKPSVSNKQVRHLWGKTDAK